MGETSSFLAGLSSEQRRALESRLLQRQSGKCFICDKPIDIVLHAGQLDVDHIDPLASQPNYTTAEYLKVCSLERGELEEWVNRDGREMKLCKDCKARGLI